MIDSEQNLEVDAAGAAVLFRAGLWSATVLFVAILAITIPQGWDLARAITLALAALLSVTGLGWLAAKVSLRGAGEPDRWTRR